MPQAFSVLVEGLDHPEGVAWDPFADCLYAGGEAGQIYRVSLSGEVEEIANTGGEILGVTVDGAGRVYACDCGRCQVVRVDPVTGVVEVYSEGAPGVALIEPNFAAFDDRGNLYVTDSGETKQDNGCILRVAPGGSTVVWSRELPRYPNGCCLAIDGRGLLVAESYLPGVSLIPIQDDGAAGTPEFVVELPGTVPDGIALDSSGALYVACYRPDRIYRVSSEGVVAIVADDPQGIDLNAPTNVAFAGADLSQMVVANVGEVHLSVDSSGVAGLPLRYPVVP